jgi:hypothetical protein
MDVPPAFPTWTSMTLLFLGGCRMIPSRSITSGDEGDNGLGPVLVLSPQRSIEDAVCDSKSPSVDADEDDAIRSSLLDESSFFSISLPPFVVIVVIVINVVVVGTTPTDDDDVDDREKRKDCSIRRQEPATAVNIRIGPIHHDTTLMVETFSIRFCQQVTSVVVVARIVSNKTQTTKRSYCDEKILECGHNSF